MKEVDSKTLPDHTLPFRATTRTGISKQYNSTVTRCKKIFILCLLTIGDYYYSSETEKDYYSILNHRAF